MIHAVTPYGREGPSSRVRVFEWLDRTSVPHFLTSYISHRNSSPHTSPVIPPPCSRQRADGVRWCPPGHNASFSSASRLVIERLPRSLRTVWKPRNRIVQASVARLPAELRRVRLLAFDLYPSSVTQFIADAHRILPADEGVDAVEVQAVLEHVLEPKGGRQVVDHTG